MNQGEGAGHGKPEEEEERMTVRCEKGPRRMSWTLFFHSLSLTPTDNLEPHPEPTAWVVTTASASGLPDDTCNNESNPIPA